MFKFTKAQLKDIHCVQIYPDGIALYATKSVHVSKDIDVDVNTLRIFHGHLSLNARKYNDDGYKFHNISYIEFYTADPIVHGVDYIVSYIDNVSAYHSAQYPDLHTVDIFITDASSVQNRHVKTSTNSGGFNIFFEDIGDPTLPSDTGGYGKGSVKNIDRTTFDLVEDYHYTDLDKWEKE